MHIFFFLFIYLIGHEQRFRRSELCRRSASTKKSMTELTDSGVSVVSDAPPLVASKDSRLLSWLKETDKKCDSKHSRHGKKYGSRSGSLERASRETWGVPAQPFVADPGMPPLPQPHTVSGSKILNNYSRKIVFLSLYRVK